MKEIGDVTEKAADLKEKNEQLIIDKDISELKTRLETEEAR